MKTGRGFPQPETVSFALSIQVRLSLDLNYEAVG